MLVVVDGPAGAGKSSVSKRVAARLGFGFLDTGALYRAVGLAAELAGLDPDQPGDLSEWLAGLDITARSADGRFLITLDGRDVEPFIRNESIGELASKLSARPEVRAFLLQKQRAAGEAGDLVAEGRDMGTVVFPGAEVKVFLTATLKERARRRLDDLQAEQPGLTLEQVAADMAGRDERDSGREVAPLAPAADAVVVDSTDMSEDQVVAHLVGLAREIQRQA